VLCPDRHTWQGLIGPGQVLVQEKGHHQSLALIDDIITINKCDSDAIEANAVVNMKIESKKLRLCQEKCAQIHVSKNSDKCETNLKVHQDAMKKVQEGSYLGDISLDGYSHILEKIKTCHVPTI
jgi:hypothetical protein